MIFLMMELYLRPVNLHSWHFVLNTDIWMVLIYSNKQVWRSSYLYIFLIFTNYVDFKRGLII